MIDGAGVTVHWNGVATGAWYRLDYTPTLNSPDWHPAGTSTQATSTSIQLTDTNAMDAVRRFYRLSRLFP